jgi:hypothetical protein
MIKKSAKRKTTKKTIKKVSKRARNPDNSDDSQFDDSPRFTKAQLDKLKKYLWEYLEYNRKMNSGEDGSSIGLNVNNFFQRQLKFEFEEDADPHFGFDYVVAEAKSLAIKLEKIINDFKKGKKIEIPKYVLRFD